MRRRWPQNGRATPEPHAEPHAHPPVETAERRKRRTRDYFDEVGRRYAEFYRPGAPLTVFPSGPMREAKAIRLVERHAERGGRALDVGCGTGHFACTLAEHGYAASGVDLSAGMVEQARRHAAGRGPGDRVAFAVGDAERLAVADGSLDVVTSLGVIEYLADDAPMLAEARRALRPGGVAVIAFCNRLFNLFSQNDYTAREFAAGDGDRLLAEARAESATVSSDDLATYARLLAEQAALAADEEAVPAPAGAAVGKAIPIDLRQHTPADAPPRAPRPGSGARR